LKGKLDKILKNDNSGSSPNGMNIKEDVNVDFEKRD